MQQKMGLKRVQRLKKSDCREETHPTRFWVHSRSALVSFAALMPSAKFALAPLTRRCMSAWSSRSSRCLALSWPELQRVRTRS